MQWILKKIIGSKNERDLRRMRPWVARINAFDEEFKKLSEDALKAKTAEFKARLAKGETADDIMVEAFAVVKNACRRLVGRTIEVCGHPVVWDMVPFDVQLVGGIVLHQGKIAEMATGEGKTLVATLPVYLNALNGRSVHVVTVNDYLARRDSEWMGAVYRYLGLTVGCIQNQMESAERRAQYACDITYGTNSEFGFDYLRDMGMSHRPEDMVQRGHDYAIVDEIDSILIDEARTPLIISGPTPYSTDQYRDLRPAVERLVRRQRDLCNRLVQEAKQQLDAGEDYEGQKRLYQVHQGMPKHPQLLHLLEDPAVRGQLERMNNAMLVKDRHEEARALREELLFVIDEKGHDASLTEKGCEALNPNDPETFVLPDLVTALAELDGNHQLSDEDKFARRQQLQDEFANKSERIHAVDQLIRAFCVYEKDVQYVVQDNQVIIVDEFTGRLMPGRRWSDGLHQAVEAKEGVRIERETQTLATITIQNYFRMYKKLAGMTGTAETEADEFHQIYKLDVVVIPTNRPVRRIDHNDMIYKTQREKFNAVLEEIEQCHQRGQPVLVGTIAVETSEMLSRMLKRQNIPHNVLNAKNHAREAEIVSRAGQAGAVTIATNMAGRGTDIKLGEGVVYFDRPFIQSALRLDQKPSGQAQTLRDLLLEKPCGLHVIGTERHESRRIDRQLRGRCARQGDPGSSRFYISLEDDLMRLFGSERIARIMVKLGIEEGQVLEHPWLNRSMQNAQRRVEQHNFSIRKRTLEYDNVMNKQREIIYALRTEIVAGDNARKNLYEILEDVIFTHAEEAHDEHDEEALPRFVDWVDQTFPVGLKTADLAGVDPKDAEALTAAVFARVRQSYELKIKDENPEALRTLERYIILQAIDMHWQEFLRNMDALRQGVGLRAYGQQDPLVEFKKEAYTMFTDLMDRIKLDVATRVFRSTTSLKAYEAFLSALPQRYVHDEIRTLGGGGARPDADDAGPPAGGARAAGEEALNQALRSKGTPIRRDAAKVGRNDPCPCGSGKKYKKCCGAAAA
jgi:preprotein translocase subunit SecA